MKIPDHRPRRRPTSEKIKDARSWFSPPKAMDAAFIDPTPSIIVAEDDDMLRTIFTSALTNRGCKVRSAKDGDTAWSLLHEAPFALLITDHEMPGLTGLEIVSKMRAESLLQPVILISGNLPWNCPDLCDLLSPGAAIEKPFGINRLIATVCGLVMFHSNSAKAAQ